MLKTGGFRSHAKQPKSFTCIKFHLATTRHEEKKLRRFLEEKLDVTLFCPLAAKQKYQKKAHVHLCVASRIGRNQSECVI